MHGLKGRYASITRFFQQPIVLSLYTKDATKHRPSILKCVQIVVCMIMLISITAFFTWEYFLYYHGYDIDIFISKWYPCFLDHSNVSIAKYENNTWESLIEKYERYRDPTKFVIFVPFFWQGLCNRIMNSISVVLFAIATNRTVWIEWDSMNTTRLSENEYGGIESLHELFNVSFPMSKPDTLEADMWLYGWCVSRIMQFSNLHSMSDTDVIHINRFDFWGTNLMKNRRYKDTVFNGLSIHEGFPFLFKKIFALKKTVEPKQCSWMFHYRTIWPPPFHTAPFDDFIKCANISGFSSEDYSTSHVISDNPSMIWERSSATTRNILSQMNLPRTRLTCRGKCGDLKSMETMYRLSGCKNAVVSLGSSFGACIAGLAQVQNWYRVGHDGVCRRVEHGLVDANCNARDGCLSTYLANL